MKDSYLYFQDGRVISNKAEFEVVVGSNLKVGYMSARLTFKLHKPKFKTEGLLTVTFQTLNFCLFSFFVLVEEIYIN